MCVKVEGEDQFNVYFMSPAVDGGGVCQLLLRQADVILVTTQTRFAE